MGSKEHFCRCHRPVSAKQIRPRRTTGLQLGIQHASKKLGDYTKLGLSHVYLRYVKENTPENAVILLPGKEAFYPEGEERIFSGEPYNKLWAIRFLYPRRVIIPSELGKTPWSEKVTHVAIVNGRGYEYLDYEVEQKAPHAVLPMHLKPYPSC